MPKYGINKAILLGNVGTEPELRFLDQGVAVCSFRLATTERAKGKDGAWYDRTDWHNIVLWRQKAELAHKFLKVGSGVYIEGRIITRSWEQEGQKRYKTEVEADSIRLLDALPENLDSSPVPPTPQTRAETPSANPAPVTGKSDQPGNDDQDDLPF